MAKISRTTYAQMYGPTVGDKVRLADTELVIEVEKDFTLYGEEVKFGGGKVIRDGMGQSQRLAKDCADTVITNTIIAAPMDPRYKPVAMLVEQPRIDLLPDGAPLPRQFKIKSADTKALEKQLATALGLKVEISEKGKEGGSLTVTYKTLEQLDDLCRRLQNSPQQS